MAPPVSICLIGPKASGKTSLLRTWVRCFHESMHGFTGHGIVRLDPKSHNAMDPVGRNEISFLSDDTEDFDKEEMEVLRGLEETPSVKTHRFEISFQKRMPARAGAALFSNDIERQEIEIVDTPGELLISSNDRPPGFKSEHRQELIQRLRRADTFIVTTPMHDLQKSAVFYKIRRLVNELTDADRFSGVKKLVLAFTHCERRFVSYGNEAFRLAADPVYLKDQIEKHYRSMPWHGNIEAFANRPGCEVFLTASGSLGFVAGNGSVNIDPHRSLADNQSFEGMTAAEKRRAGFDEKVFGVDTGRTNDWRPFLTADPFLCAIFGEPGAYALKRKGAAVAHPGTQETSDVEGSDDRAAKETRKPPRPRSIFGAVRDVARDLTNVKK